MNVPGDRTDSHFKAVPFPPHLPSKLDNSSVRLRLVAPGLLQPMLFCPNEACGAGLFRISAEVLHSHLNYALGLYPEATRQSSCKSSNFLFVTLKTQAAGSNWFRRPLFRNSPIESSGEELQARSHSIF